jgi:hypothetical protein
MTFGQFLGRVWSLILWPFYLFPRLFVKMFTRTLGVSRRPGPMDVPETNTKRVTQVLVVIGIIAVSLAVVLLSKTRPPELGAGDFVTDHRPLPEFSKLFVSDDQWVKVTIDPDADRTIAVFIDSNLVQFVQSDVVNGTLRIETSRELSQSLGSIIHLVANSLDSVIVEDGSIVEIVGVNTVAFLVDARDGSTVDAAGLASSVDIQVDKSRVTTRSVAAEVATIAIAGDSIIDVFATTSVTGSAGSQTEIRISGSPATVDIDADGGALICRSTLPLDVPFTCIR